MDKTDDKEKVKSLKYKFFDLGDLKGGHQMIYADKAINEKEHYVFTLGDGPKVDLETGEPINESQAQHKKLRCFKLTLESGTRYKVDEYIDPDIIEKVAGMFLKDGVDLSNLLHK